MKHLAVFLCVALSAVLAAPASPVQVYSYENNAYDNELGKYSYSFQLTDGTRQEQKAEIRNQGLENEYLAVVGSYEWVGPNGVRYTVKYEADDNEYNSVLKEGPPGAPLEIATALLG